MVFGWTTCWAVWRLPPKWRQSKPGCSARAPVCCSHPPRRRIHRRLPTAADGIRSTTVTVWCRASSGSASTRAASCALSMFRCTTRGDYVPPSSQALKDIAPLTVSADLDDIGLLTDVPDTELPPASAALRADRPCGDGLRAGSPAGGSGSATSVHRGGQYRIPTRSSGCRPAGDRAGDGADRLDALHDAVRRNREPAPAVEQPGDDAPELTQRSRSAGSPIRLASVTAADREDTPELAVDRG